MAIVTDVIAARIKSDRFILIPLFSLGWITCALFEFSVPGVGAVTVATTDEDLPVWVGIFFFVIWLVLLYFPPPKAEKLE